MSNQEKDSDPNFGNLKAILEEMNNSYIKVGWFDKSSKNNRQHNNKIKNVQLAIIHEYGASRKGKKVIPARPFVRPTFDKNREKYEKIVDKTVQETLETKNINHFRTNMQKLGLQIKQDQQKAILDLKTPALKAATIKRKKSSKLLVDYGELLKSNDFETGKK